MVGMTNQSDKILLHTNKSLEWRQDYLSREANLNSRWKFGFTDLRNHR